MNDGVDPAINESIVSLSPYDISFTVTGATVGKTYSVQVSNDNGADWSSPSSGQTLDDHLRPIRPARPGRALGGGFQLEQRVQREQLRRQRHDDHGRDHRRAERGQRGVEAGGGMVYFPNGTYYISHIALPPNVVLEGQSEYGAQIYYDGSGGSSFIRTNGANNASYDASNQGVAQLSIFLSNTTNVTDRPDIFIYLGSGYNTSNLSNNLFVSNVNINYPTSTGVDSGTRGLCFDFGGDQNLLIQNNTFVGWEAIIYGYESQYSIIRNNYLEYSYNQLLDTATYAFWENNQAVIHTEYDQDCHGLFARADAYFANNVVENSGNGANNQTDGEAFCTEASDVNGCYNYGTVTSATSTSITVSPIVTLVTPTVPYGVLSIVITSGTGIGQLRQVTSISGDTINVSSPFTITPDSTSVFTLIAPCQGATVYHNTAENCEGTICIYGNSFDDVVADNTLINSGGVLLYAVRDNASGQSRYAPTFFTRVTGNILLGISRLGNYESMGIYTARFGTASYTGVQAYGDEFCDNTITGNNAAVTNSSSNSQAPFVGIFVTAYGYSTQSNGVGVGDATDTLIQGNNLSDLPTGITLTTSDYAQVVSNNLYDGTVLTFLQNSGSTYGTSTETLDNRQRLGQLPDAGERRRPGNDHRLGDQSYRRR